MPPARHGRPQFSPAVLVAPRVHPTRLGAKLPVSALDRIPCRRVHSCRPRSARPPRSHLPPCTTPPASNIGGGGSRLHPRAVGDHEHTASRCFLDACGGISRGALSGCGVCRSCSAVVVFHVKLPRCPPRAIDAQVRAGIHAQPTQRSPDPQAFIAPPRSGSPAGASGATPPAESDRCRRAGCGPSYAPSSSFHVERGATRPRAATTWASDSAAVRLGLRSETHRLRHVPAVTGSPRHDGPQRHARCATEPCPMPSRRSAHILPWCPLRPHQARNPYPQRDIVRSVSRQAASVAVETRPSFTRLHERLRCSGQAARPTREARISLRLGERAPPGPPDKQSSTKNRWSRRSRQS